jgi:katanin p60 ATPase-containing subunit A1
MSTSLLAIKASSEANTAEQKRLVERKRNILVLVHHHLIENGYIEAAERLQHESGGVLTKFAAADNIDLGLVLSEYETYYEMRFDKKPKLARKLDGDEAQSRLPSKSVKTDSAQKRGANTSSNKPAETGDGNKLPALGRASPSSAPSEPDPPVFGVSGASIGTTDNSKTKKVAAVDDAARLEDRLLKPPPFYGGDGELRQLANVICREIYQDSPNVRFDDIIQLDEAKRLLIEAVQLPLRFPYLFTGILRPWRGILLHGPPGTGKTLLAKAVATECSTTFFNISASTLVSKWRGDSEKLVRVLFEVARYHGPSTIFLDEIDSILTSRDGEGGEHEASRRMKTELLIQMDGVKSSSSGAGGSNSSGTEGQVFVMAASNLPWDLDIAVLRRLEKRVLVPLPSVGAREAMFRKHLGDRSVTDMNFAAIAAQTEGYSGADIELLSRESAMMPVRRLMQRMEEIDLSGARTSGSQLIPDPPPNNRAGMSRSVPAISVTRLTPSSLKISAVCRQDRAKELVGRRCQHRRSGRSSLDAGHYVAAAGGSGHRRGHCNGAEDHEALLGRQDDEIRGLAARLWFRVVVTLNLTTKDGICRILCRESRQMFMALR